MQRAYWLNWKRLSWSRKTYKYFVADYGATTSVIYIRRFSNFCRYFSFSSDDYKFTSCLLFSVFSAMIWALKMPAFFFWIDDQRKTARTLQWLLDFDWLPISHECLILSANCITMPDKVIIKNAMSQTSICQWVLGKQSSKQCFSRVREIRNRGVFVSVKGVYARNIC